ncbi:hypothetical protein BBO99_00001171 [Phytophthora kernoviae]|uniref:VPS9 domain-containing protein n=2 Tax=Phytophthora kernoviae TaxID=325452 RepID=A0A421F6S6_9STRA|nr:hypothetical protein G195_005140 [Phytophthora kernoviae 00238/432]KAG2529654.1 hypothetical protein JM18_001403 [Phytophthora kernoviae]KAG2531171.1 hypothetical protein JM16_001267 [Phytophthora kernoviae]RLN26636.1 hypothetical protein BBI17_004064 [Phytophthora kernoviae]RLN84690.1 hypothetical protein BBO99_00001171 [Phytophthora kernoviae]
MGVEELSVSAASGNAERVIDAKSVPTPTPTSSSPASFVESEAQALRRRTSIPSTFSFGGVDHAIPTAEVTQRRWRSFDAAVLDGPAASTLNMLTQRIQEESQQIQLVAEMATGNRSLAVLSDMRTLLALDQHSDDSEECAPRHRGSFAANQTLLEGIEQSDRALAEDWLRHVLQLQAKYLKTLMELHSDKAMSVSGLTLPQLLQQVDELAGDKDEPTAVLVKFEKLLSRQKLLKPDLKKALDRLCLNTMRSFTRASSQSGPKSIFDDREARDVMQSLVQEVVDAIATEAKLEKSQLPVLKVFVEHMVFSRLACACYRSTAADLDELNASWREQAPKMRGLSLEEVGLSVPIPEDSNQLEMFSDSIAAFNQLPHLVPASVLTAFMRAICTLYREAKDGLGLDSSCISADVLLPLLVFVLSHCELPHLHSQVYLMEQYAIDESQDGSEAAYYLACLQAAMGYIMGKDEAENK